MWSAQAFSLSVTDGSVNNVSFWGQPGKLFTSSNWLVEWGLYWVSSHCPCLLSNIRINLTFSNTGRVLLAIAEVCLYILECKEGGKKRGK